MLTVYDETMINKMSKDELREALRNMQNLICAQDNMIERQGEALMSYKCLLDDLNWVNNTRDHIEFITGQVAEFGSRLSHKYAKEGLECCAEAPCNEPS